MDCVTLLEKARAAGVEIEQRDGQLVVRGSQREKVLIDEILSRKSEILAVLAPQPPQDESANAPVPLDAPCATPMPAGMFDGWFGEMVEAVTTALEAPRELPALMGLGALAAACQGRYSIRPEADYFEPTNAWFACALPSGERKTAVVERMNAPIVEWQDQETAALSPDIERATSDRATQQTRIKAIRQKAARAKEREFKDLQQEIADMEAELPTIPTAPVLFTDDVTPEHLGTMLAKNNERMAILSDEGGIFDLMAGRYSNGIPNLDVWLKGHSGSTVRVDRGSRPPVYLHHPAITIAISPQPDVLRGLAAHKGFRGRGLLARFLYALPVSRVGFRTLKARPVPDHVSQAYADGITAILNTSLAIGDNGRPRPHVLRLSSQAWHLWKDHARTVEAEMRPGGRFEHITDWAGKFPGAVARLAALLHVAEHAHERPEAVEVSPDTMSRALALAELLADHALLVFGLMGTDPAVAGARKVLQWMERGRHETFTKRDCWHDLRGAFHKVSDIEPALDVLMDTGHIMRIESPRKGPGPKGEWFQVNPVLVTQWSTGTTSDQIDRNDQVVGEYGHLGQSGPRFPDDADDEVCEWSE